MYVTSRLWTLHWSGLSEWLGLYVRIAVVLRITALESRSEVSSTTTSSLSVRFMQSSNGDLSSSKSPNDDSSLIQRFVATPVDTTRGFGLWLAREEPLVLAAAKQNTTN